MVMLVPTSNLRMEQIVDWDWTPPTDRPIARLKEVVAYKNRFVTVFNDKVAFANVKMRWWLVPVLWALRLPRYLRIQEKGGESGAAALATCGDLVALVLVYRYPLGAWEWGIPRGFAHSADPEETVRTELKEELGAEPRRTRSIGIVTPNSGLLAGHTQLFHAQYDTPVSTPKDTGEVRKVRWLSVPDLAAAIEAGHVTDGFTLSALSAAAVRGLVHLGPQAA